MQQHATNRKAYQPRLFDLVPEWKPRSWGKRLECWSCGMWIVDGEDVAIWVNKTFSDYLWSLRYDFNGQMDRLITAMVPMHGYCAVIDAFDSEDGEL